MSLQAPKQSYDILFNQVKHGFHTTIQLKEHLEEPMQSLAAAHRSQINPTS